MVRVMMTPWLGSVAARPERDPEERSLLRRLIALLTLLGGAALAVSCGPEAPLIATEPVAPPQAAGPTAPPRPTPRPATAAPAATLSVAAAWEHVPAVLRPATREEPRGLGDPNAPIQIVELTDYQ